MTPEPFDRVRTATPTRHPPCQPDPEGRTGCWVPAGRIGWVWTRGTGTRCEWDEQTRKWTHCDEILGPLDELQRAHNRWLNREIINEGEK